MPLVVAPSGSLADLPGGAHPAGVDRTPAKHLPGKPHAMAFFRQARPEAPIHAAPGRACRQRLCRCGSAGDGSSSCGTWRGEPRPARRFMRAASRPAGPREKRGRSHSRNAGVCRCVCGRVSLARPSTHNWGAMIETRSRRYRNAWFRARLARHRALPVVRAHEQAPQVRRQDSKACASAIRRERARISCCTRLHCNLALPGFHRMVRKTTGQT